MSNSSLLNSLKISIVLVFLCFNLLSSAQNKGNFSITGSLIDSITKQPIEYASVAIYKMKDTSLITGTISNPKGQFVLKDLNPSKYLIKCSFIGYKIKMINIEISNTSLDLSEPITLSYTSTRLNEVMIIDKQNEKQVNIEKTKINVSQNISSVSGNVIDVLKSQSSINIDAENNVYLRGNSNILILLDGKPTTVSSLNSIPSSSVDNIEIITNPDAKYDAEGTGGIINIVTKKQNISGFSGAASLNYGFNNRINGGLSFNYSKKIWNVGFNYNGKYEKSNFNSNLTRQLYTQPIFVDQVIKSTQKNPTHTASFQLSVKPNKKNLIALNVKILLPDLYNIQNISGKQVSDTLPTILFNRRNDITFSRKTIEGTLSYKRIIEKNKHELSFDAMFSRTKGSRPAKYYIEEELLQKSEGGGAPTNISFQVDYLKSLFKSGKLESGLKGFSRWNQFNYYFYDLDTISGQWISNAAYSNDLQHQEYIYSAYLMYSDTLFKKLYYKIGARLEYNTSELIQKSLNDTISREYFFPFPYLLLKRAINKSQSIALSINRRITRPTYPQLNPFINVIDQMTYETGNKYLKPEISDKAELNYSFIKEEFQFRTNVFASTTKDFITQVSLLSNPDKLIVTYVNGNRQNKIGCDIDLTYKFSKIFALNPAFSVFYAKSNGTYNEIDLSTDNIAWTGNIKASIKPEQKTELQIFLNYNSPIALPQFNLSEIYYTDIAIKRAFLKNKLSVSLTLTDVFNTREWEIKSDNQVYKLYNYSKAVSRIFWIGLTYNFNSYKNGKNQKNDGSENDNSVIKLGQ